MDRNFNAFGVRYRHIRSLSVRRAWIEIVYTSARRGGDLVALRKESVDRNIWSHTAPYLDNKSLSVRRAWIEMCVAQSLPVLPFVALRKESVDRNSIIATQAVKSVGRSP